MSEKYDHIIGFDGNTKKELHSVEETAEYICDRGRYGDLTITKPDGTVLLNTYGIFINQIVDFDYRKNLCRFYVKNSWSRVITICLNRR